MTGKHFRQSVCRCPAPENWWRRTGSNRRPPACKAGALPTELRPLLVSLRSWSNGRGGKWWAWVDLNYRPHAYQACALTKLSYRPITYIFRHEWPRASLSQPAEPADQGLGPTVSRRMGSVLSVPEPGRDTPAATPGIDKVSQYWNFFQRQHP